MPSVKGLGIGKRGRGLAKKVKGALGAGKMDALTSGAKKKVAGTSAPTTTTSTKGPAWKPAKATTTGNYGAAVSTAAKARNAARKTSATPATGSAQPTGSSKPIRTPSMTDAATRLSAPGGAYVKRKVRSR